MARPYQKKMLIPTQTGKFLVYLRSDPSSKKIVDTLDEAKAFLNKSARDFYQSNTRDILSR